MIALSGCTGYESAYEQGVADYEPIYCYRSLSDATCFRRPYHRDERRLINYYGPSPRRFERPPPAKPARLDPPPAPPRDALVSPPRSEPRDGGREQKSAPDAPAPAVAVPPPGTEAT